MRSTAHLFSLGSSHPKGQECERKKRSSFRRPGQGSTPHIPERNIAIALTASVKMPSAQLVHGTFGSTVKPHTSLQHERASQHSL